MPDSGAGEWAYYIVANPEIKRAETPLGRAPRRCEIGAGGIIVWNVKRGVLAAPLVLRLTPKKKVTDEHT